MKRDWLATYTPSSTAPWDRQRAGHLLRRTGFCPSPQELARALEEGPQACVLRLVQGEAEAERVLELDDIAPSIANGDKIEELRQWWCLRLKHTKRPFHARMALFWHDHFATSQVKVQDVGLMYRQLLLLEDCALGPFGAFLKKIARDPAMVRWLDGNQNAKGRPNENFAREILELFSLGLGNYTERDIQEAARAFTGWHERRGQFAFQARLHDDGEKEVLGVRGQLDGDDVIEAIVSNPACSQFLSGKLLRAFATPDPDPEWVAAFAKCIRSTGYDMQASMQRLLSSEAFFDPARFRARIKSPVEYVLGIARSLELKVAGPALARATSDMGQRLLEPPSVDGWETHRGWLDSATMLVRLNYAKRALRGEKSEKCLEACLERNQLASKEEIVRFACELCFDGNQPRSLQPTFEALKGTKEDILRGALEIAMSSPEYQLA